MTNQAAACQFGPPQFAKRSNERNANAHGTSTSSTVSLSFAEQRSLIDKSLGLSVLHNIFITYDICDCLEVPAFARNIVTDYVDALCSSVSTLDGGK